MKLKKVTAALTAAAMLLAPIDGVWANTAQQPEEEKQYIIMAEDEAAYNEAEEEVGEGISMESSVLAENNVIVAELSEDEAETLSENEHILIEEDIMLCASTEAVKDASGSLTSEEEAPDCIAAKDYQQNKQEMKRRKMQQFEEIIEAEAEADTTEPEYEWNLQAVNADEASECAKAASKKVKVAVLDSGVDYVTGINLAGYANLVEEEDYVVPIFQDLTGHGTGVASIISANGEEGLQGVNPNAELYSVKALDENNQAPLSRIIRGIYWCIENGMNIINMSFGTPSYSEALRQAVSDAHAAGLLMVAAAGNSGDAVEYPAAFPEVMAVASTNAEAEISEFCNTGEELEVAAPGEKIRVASFFNGTVVTHGTSVAAPHVSGVASLLWERDLTKSSEFIRQLISHSAKEIEGVDECGLLDAKHALDCYDAFAEGYDETAEALKVELPENAALPETFEEVSDDKAYVEGRWGTEDHKAAVNIGSTGLTTAAINLIKKGAAYPDKDNKLELGTPNPEWHGKWERTVKENNITTIVEVNYIAVLEMVTEIALEGGAILPYMKWDWFWGMNEPTYTKVKTDINYLTKKCAELLPERNTKENRMYFLYGCALHGIQDVFAHSTVRKNGTLIKDTDPAGKKGDDLKNYPRRYHVAVKLTEYALKNLTEGLYSDGRIVLKALKEKYADAGEFKVYRLKKYMNANGYSHSIITNVNADTFIKN